MLKMDKIEIENSISGKIVSKGSKMDRKSFETEKKKKQKGSKVTNCVKSSQNRPITLKRQ